MWWEWMKGRFQPSQLQSPSWYRTHNNNNNCNNDNDNNNYNNSWLNKCLWNQWKLTPIMESMKTNSHDALLQCFCSQNIQTNLIQRRWRAMLCMGNHESRPVSFSSKAPWCFFQEQVLWDSMTQEHGAFPGWQGSIKILLGLALFFFWSLDVTIFYSPHSFLTHSVFLFLIWLSCSYVSVIIKISDF